MDFSPYGGRAALLAAALANTAAPAGADEIRDVVRGYHRSPVPRLQATQARALLDWSARLREVFASASVGRKVELANELLAASASRPYISRHDGLAPHLHYTGEAEDIVTRVRAFTAGGVAHLICRDPARLTCCASEDCPTVYVDVSRNGRRRFCSVRCANRVHVADHRKRRTTGSRGANSSPSSVARGPSGGTPRSVATTSGAPTGSTSRRTP